MPGVHANFDARVDPFVINADAVAQGDLDTPEPFRKYAQYWLPGDEFGTGRALGKSFEKIYKHSPVDLIAQIKAIYAAAETRQDVEDTGLQVHEPL